MGYCSLKLYLGLTGRAKEVKLNPNHKRAEDKNAEGGKAKEEAHWLISTVNFTGLRITRKAKEGAHWLISTVDFTGLRTTQKAYCYGVSREI